VNNGEGKKAVIRSVSEAWGRQLMYKKIVVPLDGSKFAESALEHVKTIALGCPVNKVILLRILVPVIVDARDYIAAESIHEAEEQLEADAKEYLEKTAAGLRKKGLSVEIRMEIGTEPAEKILEVAKEEKADLIIMSTHGRSGFQQWIFGSVAHRLLVHSSVPILMAVPADRKKYKR
jgi:nucleotide-binding universal stress UspA family protein